MGVVTPQPSDRPLYWPSIVEQLQAIFPDEELYLVGGVVRDVYRRSAVHDIDLASPKDGQPIARHIANALQGDYYPLDSTRGVGRAIVEWEDTTFTIDVAQFRGNSLYDDLLDRDFTVNALATPLQQLEFIIDPTNGLDDLKQKVIRLCNPHAISDDPLRMLRAVRLSLSHQLRLLDDTKAAIRANLSKLSQVSAERIRDEFFKLLDGPRPHAAITILSTLGILESILPETSTLKGVEQSPPHVYDVWRHTLGVVENMGHILSIFSPQRNDDIVANFGLGMFKFAIHDLHSQITEHLNNIQWPNGRSHRALLIFAALAHDIGKPATQTVDEKGVFHFYQHEVVGAEIVEKWAQRLALSNDETERLVQIVLHHLRPAQLARAERISTRAKYRYWRVLGATGVDVCLHAIADQLGKYGPTLEQSFWLHFLENLSELLAVYFKEPETMINIKPLLNGHELMETFGLDAGPKIGQLLEAMKEAQALGEINNREDAIMWVKQVLNEY
ncbi:MAG: hypothetical protein CUN55_06510 [Phototrophicales bacterium]|nr:MAG: hypothetical protein CUN55_06510 [Phototrophicales bacterium]